MGKRLFVLVQSMLLKSIAKATRSHRAVARGTCVHLAKGRKKIPHVFAMNMFYDTFPTQFEYHSAGMRSNVAGRTFFLFSKASFP